MSAPVGDFSLTSEEVMRGGLSVRDGALVARPGLGSRVLSVLIVCFFGGIVAVGVTMSPAVLVVVPAVTYIAARHLARLRVAVVATTDEVIVRNRWRSVRVPADEVVAIDVVARQRTLRDDLSEPFLSTWQWPAPATIDVGVVRTGRSEQPCDALVSASAGNDPSMTSVTRMKVDALRRWRDSAPLR